MSIDAAGIEPYVQKIAVYVLCQAGTGWLLLVW